MANHCCYKILVKGKKNACYAFLGSTSRFDDPDIIEEAGTDENFSMAFFGVCKNGVDVYCGEAWNGLFSVKLPDDYQESYEIATEKYMYYSLQTRSKMFEVEVVCNSLYEFDDPEEAVYEHYRYGDCGGGPCPEVLWFEDKCPTWLEDIGTSEEEDK